MVIGEWCLLCVPGERDAGKVELSGACVCDC